VLATSNQGKVAEIQAILGPFFELRPRPAEVGEVEETADTLEGNARLKAMAVAAATGEAAIADDTGLEVVALGGRPGVHSARFAGPSATAAANVDLLLSRMEGAGDRRARFRTIAMVCWPDGREVWAEGTVDGEISLEPAGAGGFGYDPVFVAAGQSRTFAQMEAGEKNALSHRGRALRALAARLEAPGG
jgi:XTP/dITP diphosphohydrolase